MALYGVDCSQPVAGALLAKAGVAWCGRYVGKHPSGDLTTAEHLDHARYGVADLLIWEFSTDDLGTKPRAWGAAVGAYADCKALGVPLDGTVAVVLCEDNVNPDRAAVISDMAAASTGVLRPAGLLAVFYGRKEIARTLLDQRAVDGAFVVDTWPPGGSPGQWNYRQLPNSGQTTIGGVACDIDDAPNPVGLWGAATTVVPPPVFTPIEGDPDVAQIIHVAVQLSASPGEPGSYAGYADVAADASKIVAMSIDTWDPALLGRYLRFDTPAKVSLGPGRARVVVTCADQPPGLVGVDVAVAA